MNSIMEVFWDTCAYFTTNAKDVTINLDKIKTFSLDSDAENLPHFRYPEFIHSYKDTALYELTACSVNYCYWYGVGDFRPNKCSSSLMYDLLNEAYEQEGYKWNENLIEVFIEKMAVNRFPLIEQRARHLRELISSKTLAFCEHVIEGGNIFQHYLPELIRLFPGFASDMFMKRAFLFFIQLDRKLGYFGKEMNKLPIPADYQIPKMLKYKGLISYSPELEKKINNKELIPSGSRQECEIRAAAILACKYLSENSRRVYKTGEISQQPEHTMADIDTWLWCSRKQCNDPFHLTVTTDY